jgi:heptosyltransferase-2
MTNIGDVVLSCPVIDILRRDFPQAQMDVVVGPKAVSLFADNPNFHIKVFDKQAPIGKKISWFLDLRRAHYDCVVDLRRTALGFFLASRYRTPLFGRSLAGHKKDIHLNRLRQIYDFDVPADKQYAILPTKEDEDFFEGAVVPVLQERHFVVIAPGAASSDKRWHPEGFAQVADYLSNTYKVVFVGDDKDVEIVDNIQGRMRSPALSLTGKINLRQLAYVLKKCSLVLAHDSGVLHLSCYFNVPVVALWGPTDINRYAPWSSKFIVVRHNEKCPRCQNPKTQEKHNCMSFIKAEDVVNAISKFS